MIVMNRKCPRTEQKTTTTAITATTNQNTKYRENKTKNGSKMTNTIQASMESHAVRYSKHYFGFRWNKIEEKKKKKKN